MIWANHLVRSATSRHAERREGDPRQRDAGERRGPHRVGRRDLPPAGCRRIFGGRERCTCRRRARRAARSCWRRAAARDSKRSPPTARKSCCRSPASRCCAGSSTASRRNSINDITVVGGYRADAIDTAGIRLVVNERYAQTGELASLACAVGIARRRHGDFLRRPAVPQLCAARSGRERQPISASWSIRRRTDAGNRTVRDFAYCSRADDRGAVRHAGLAGARGRASTSIVGGGQSRLRRRAAGSAC